MRNHSRVLNWNAITSLLLFLGFLVLACESADMVAVYLATPTMIALTLTPIPQPQTTEPSAISPSITPSPSPTTPPSVVATTPRPRSPTPIPPGYSRTKPIPFGQSVLYTTPDRKMQVSWKVLEAYRGDEAWSRIHQANMFNNPPIEGQEYILLKVRADYVRGDSTQVIQLDGRSCVIVTSDNRIFTKYEQVIVAPTPWFNRQVYPGGFSDGWLAFPSGARDPHPLLQCSRNADGSGGVWMDLR